MTGRGWRKTLTVFRHLEMHPDLSAEPKVQPNKNLYRRDVVFLSCELHLR